MYPLDLQRALVFALLKFGGKISPVFFQVDCIITPQRIVYVEVVSIFCPHTSLSHLGTNSFVFFFPILEAFFIRRNGNQINLMPD